MKTKTLLLCVLFLATKAFSQEKSFQYFTGSGKKVKTEKVFRSCQEYQLVFFGELHNNPISHWMELKLYQYLLSEDSATVLGMEMFERDNQPQLDDFVTNRIAKKQFDTLARVWKNHDTDYLPLLAWAQQTQQKVVATNVPRSLANLVYKHGFRVLDTLSNSALVAKLPILYDSTVACYQYITAMAHHGGTYYLAEAQALKDATMAESILKSVAGTKVHFLQLNGAYHSENKEGICWYIQQAEPTIRYITITTVLQKDLSNLQKEYYHKADYILVVPEDMTTTY